MSAASWLAWLALASPLLGLFFNVGMGAGFSRKQVGVVSSLAILFGFGCSLGVLAELLQQDPARRVHLSIGWHWLTAGTFSVDFSLLVDPLSCVMLLVVTGIGFLIHAYSVGYMHGDGEEKRFFAYMNIFVFSMVLLVLAGNFLLLLIGWGLVGLSSYLLIGFWWQRPAAVAAAKKAFVMNAIGDVGIVLALFLIWLHVGSLDYLTVFSRAGHVLGTGSHTGNWIALLLLIGAVAKSAQLPLQTWLPDAMEGPTPVSALIHAATMVTAGVYLVARCWPLYQIAPDIHDLVALIGAVTLVMAGLIALVQTDIKRIIAYSTMSQIGYMFVGVGVGAYSAGIFHLVTHAFFKALLFLGAGVVIHALSDEQDVRKMGGLMRYLPYTGWLMWIGGLALAGMPPFSGFFSKDRILGDALAMGGPVGDTAFALGLFGTLLTGLYTFRMIFLVFHGEPSAYAREHVPAHTAHGEGPTSMLWTIGVLGAGAVGIGWLSFPGFTNLIQDFLNPVLTVGHDATNRQEGFATIASFLLALTGIVVAAALYAGRRGDEPRRVSAALWPLPRVLEEKFGFDIAYDYGFYRPAAALARGGRMFFEGPIVGGSIALVTGVTRWTAGRLSAAQTGILRSYAVGFALGLTALMIWFVAKGAL